MNIAVCDDEEIQRSLLKGYLEAWAEAGSHALRISLFSTGRQFLESLKETRFDIVLLDIQMPDMDGMSAAKALRETDGQTGIFFVTGYEDYLVQGYEVEAFRYLIKPVSEEKLRAALDQFLKKRGGQKRVLMAETPDGVRGWRHDYHNHIQAMKAYAELGKYGELITYLGRLDENLYQVDTVIKTGNLMMDAVLGSKLGLMKKRGIRTDVTVHVPKGMKLTDMELCVLVGNLLDNAIEACEEVEEEENRFIRIYMDTLQEQFYLSVMNGMNGRAQRKGAGFVSRKRPGGLPGFGLQRVDRIVEKYGGFLNRQTEEGVFATEILLPLAVQGE